MPSQVTNICIPQNVFPVSVNDATIFWARMLSPKWLSFFKFQTVKSWQLKSLSELSHSFHSHWIYTLHLPQIFQVSLSCAAYINIVKFKHLNLIWSIRHSTEIQSDIHGPDKFYKFISHHTFHLYNKFCVQRTLCHWPPFPEPAIFILWATVMSFNLRWVNRWRKQFFQHLINATIYVSETIQGKTRVNMKDLICCFLHTILW